MSFIKSIYIIGYEKKYMLILRSFIVFFILLLLISCGKKETLSREIVIGNNAVHIEAIAGGIYIYTNQGKLAFWGGGKEITGNDASPSISLDDKYPREVMGLTDVTDLIAGT